MGNKWSSRISSQNFIILSSNISIFTLSHERLILELSNKNFQTLLQMTEILDLTHEYKFTIIQHLFQENKFTITRYFSIHVYYTRE